MLGGFHVTPHLLAPRVGDKGSVTEVISSAVPRDLENETWMT